MSHDSPATKQDTTRASNGDGRALHWRALRWIMLALAVLAIAAGVALWVVTRSWFIIAQVQPELERRLGGPVNIADATYRGNGRFVFRGVVVHAPGYSGAAGRVGQIDRVELQLDPSRLLEGSGAIQDLRLDGVHLRLSEDARQPGVFSFMALRPDWSSEPDDESSSVLPPSIEIHDLQLELGTHDGDSYTRIGVRRLAGEMHPAAEDDAWYVFELGEVDEDGVGIGERGLLIKGEWNVETNEHNSRMEGLALDDRTYAMCPQIVRDWWDRMALEGRVSGVRLTWKRGQPVTVEFDVADVALTIPVETQEIWARYRGGRIEQTPNRPRMRVSEGAIRLEGDHLTLDNLRGELGAEDASDDVVGVPYAVRLEIPALPKLEWQQRSQWLDEALKRAAFEMVFTMDDFSLAAEDIREQPAVDLPRVVAEALERFEMQDWVLNTTVTITRDPPVQEPDGSLTAQLEQWTGQAYIRNASCRFENFPYPLDDVSAYLEFDRDTVQLVYLYGYGSEHTRIRLSGEIAPPSNQAAVHLKLAAESVPIDGQLREALDPDQARVFDALLHESSARGLEAVGLLPNAAEIEQMRQRREQVVHELASLSSGAGTVPVDAETVKRLGELRGELERLDRRIAAGPFRLGGHVDLDLRIDREFGSNKPTYVTGTMAVRDGGIVYDRFPYPLTITGGVIEWAEHSITLRGADDDPEAGITFITPGGGLGRVAGDILFPAGTNDVQPQLQIDVMDDVMSAAVLAAIPPGDAEREALHAEAEATGATTPLWPGVRLSEAASVLEELNVTGGLDYRGRIEADANGAVDYQFGVMLRRGMLEPGTGAAELVGESGLYWPSGFAIRDVEAFVRVGRDAIELHELHGRHSKNGDVTADGYMRLDSDRDNAQLTVQMMDLPIGEYLIDLAPREGIDRARELWQRYQPHGLFDTTFAYRSADGREHEADLRLRPRQLQATVGDAIVEFAYRGGELWLRQDQVHFADLQLALSSGDQPQGHLALNGIYGAVDTAQNLELLGRWTAGRLECPIVTEAMELIGGATEAAEFRALQPRGTFDATFRYQSPRADQPSDFEMVIQPQDIALQIHDTPVNLSLEPGGLVRVLPGIVTAESLSGTLGDGTFRVSGSVEQRDAGATIDLALEFDGQLSSPEVVALLPQTARDALQGIDFSDGAGSTLRAGRLRLLHDGTRADSSWSTDFRAVVKTDDAAFSGGVDFSHINGIFDVALRTEPDETPRLSILADVATMRLLGNTMTNAAAEIVLLPNDRIGVRNYRADLHSGVIAADAQFGIGSRLDYDATVTLAGVSIDGLLASDDQEQPDGTFALPPIGQRGGDVFGRLAIQGLRGRPDIQTGRGSVRIAQGRIARMPFLLSVLHVMELMPPLSDTLDFGDIEFYIEGEQAVLEHILFECPTLMLRGSGTMDLTTMDMDVLFRSRNKLIVLGEVIGEVSDQLFGIRVRGPLTEPSASLVPLPGLSEPRTEAMPELADGRAAGGVD